MNAAMKTARTKKILLIGRGHLGALLKEIFFVSDELHWTREMADLTFAALRGLPVMPEFVVNCAGKTDLPWCEANPLEAFRCNVSAPLAVRRAVGEAFGDAVPYIHLSSGCVWDGPFKKDGSPFLPDDPPVPACFYSWTKSACDAMMLREGGAPVVILRPRQVYSPSPSARNTLAKLRGYPKLLGSPNSMTSADTIALTVAAIIADQSRKTLGKILNVYETGWTTPYRVGQLLAEAGLRTMPEKLEKNALDAWHKPKRVDAVIADPFFEALVRPPKIEDELRRNIALFSKAAKSQA
jgi:dTDP-4-dehydrorhamnose reductase